MQKDRDLEIAQNYAFFQSVMSELIPQHQGEYALLRNREIVGLFQRAIDAALHGNSLFDDGLFSVQRVAERPLDLGFLSYGSNDRVID